MQATARYNGVNVVSIQSGRPEGFTHRAVNLEIEESRRNPLGLMVGPAVGRFDGGNDAGGDDNVNGLVRAIMSAAQAHE